MMWPFLPGKSQSYLGTEKRRRAATAWLIGSLKFNYPRADVLPPRCSSVLKEQVQRLHRAEPTGTEGSPSPGCQQQPILCWASPPRMDTSGEERVGALLWKTSISICYHFPNLPRQRNFPSSCETCPRKMVLPLPNAALSSGSTSLL